MELTIRKAKTDEFDKVLSFYFSVIDALEGAEYNLGWVKEVYPSRTLLKTAIEKGELYVGEVEEKLAAAMIVNRESNDGYNGVAWETDALASEVLIIHALTTHPDYSGKGYGTKMVEKAIALGRESCSKAIRLDVLKGNFPAERLYRKIGFKYITTVQMYYENTGLTDFLLYEYKI